MNETNVETLEEVRCDIIGTNFTGRVILDCYKGRIEDIEVKQRRAPPWKRRQSATVDAKPNPL